MITDTRRCFHESLGIFYLRTHSIPLTVNIIHKCAGIELRRSCKAISFGELHNTTRFSRWQLTKYSTVFLDLFNQGATHQSGISIKMPRRKSIVTALIVVVAFCLLCLLTHTHTHSHKATLQREAVENSKRCELRQ